MTEIRINPTLININASALADNTSRLAANESADYVQNQSLVGNISYLSNVVTRGPLTGNKKVNAMGFDTSSGELIFDIET